MNDKEKQEQYWESFQIALKLEEEGKELFTKAALSTKSKLARQTFEFLAKEEDKHIAQIKNFYKTLEISDGEDFPDIEPSTAEEKLESFNKKLETIKDEYQITGTDIEAYQMALKVENGSEEYYQERLKSTQNPKLQKFYKWLIEEEKMHSRLIKSCLKFVEDPAEWFRRRKKP